MSILSFFKNIKNISKISLSIEYKYTEEPRSDLLLKTQNPYKSKAFSKSKLEQVFNEQGECLHVNHNIHSHSSETRYFNEHPYTYDEYTYCCKDCGKTKLSHRDLPSTNNMSFSSPYFENDRSSWGEI